MSTQTCGFCLVLNFHKSLNRKSLSGIFITIGMLVGILHAQTYKYDFGSGTAASGYTKVTPTTRYSIAQGYGFDSIGSVVAVSRSGTDVLRDDYCTGTKEMFFSVKVPQGNYEVTFIVGDVAGTSNTTIEAENRRLLFDRVTTQSGKTISKTITLNRREVKSDDGTVTMSIKDRELTYYTWDEKLTLRFSGSKPCVCGVELTKVDTAITMFLCGNSTVVDQVLDPWASWGQMIPRMFLPGVCVANYSESGLTSGDFISMKRLDKLLADSKAGDYVFVEFGHNDQKATADVAAYPDHLKTFRDKALAKNCKPIFVAPTARYGDTDPKTSIAGLADTMRATAKSLGVTLIDLNAMTITLNKALGSKDSAAVYMDISHCKEFGAFEFARCVAKSIKELNNSLTPFLNPDLPVFDPSKPDPIDYLTTLTIGTMQQDRTDVPKKFLSKSGISFDPSTNRVRFAVDRSGDALFSLHSLDGKLVASKRITISRTKGSFGWPEIGNLPRGIYLITMVIGNQPCGKTIFCLM